MEKLIHKFFPYIKKHLSYFSNFKYFYKNNYPNIYVT